MNTSAQPTFQMLRQRLGRLAFQGRGFQVLGGGAERFGLVGVRRFLNELLENLAFDGANIGSVLRNGHAAPVAGQLQGHAYMQRLESRPHDLGQSLGVQVDALEAQAAGQPQFDHGGFAEEFEAAGHGLLNLPAQPVKVGGLAGVDAQAAERTPRNQVIPELGGDPRWPAWSKPYVVEAAGSAFALTRLCAKAFQDVVRLQRAPD